MFIYKYIYIYINFLYLSLLPICMLKPSCNRFIHTSVFHQILQVVPGWTLIPRISPSRKFQQTSCHLKSAFQLFSDVCFFFLCYICVFSKYPPPNIYQSTTSGYPPNFWIKKHSTTGGAFNLFEKKYQNHSQIGFLFPNFSLSIGIKNSKKPISNRKSKHHFSLFTLLGSETHVMLRNSPGVYCSLWFRSVGPPPVVGTPRTAHGLHFFCFKAISQGGHNV